MAKVKTSTVKVSLTKALAEVKKIDKQIDQLAEETIVATKKGNSKQLIGAKGLGSADEFLANTKGIAQKLMDLYIRRVAIKTAIAKANVSTTVTIKGEEYNIITAIDAKNTNQTLVDIYSAWLGQFDKVDEQIEKQEQLIQDYTQTTLQSAYGSNQQAKQSAHKDIEASTRLLYAGSVCSNFTRQEIAAKLDNAREMLAEIDMCLSEVNSRTDIEIPM